MHSKPFLVGLLAIATLALGIPAASRAHSAHAAATGSRPSTSASRHKRRPNPRLTPPPGASTTLVSSDSNGVAGNNISTSPSISADGRFVAFQSPANTLVSGDANNTYDVFVKDTLTGATTAVSRVVVGGGGTAPSISADSRYVAFSSADSSLVTGDTNGLVDVFVRDRSTGNVSRVSVDSSGNEATGGNSDDPSISSDGRYVVFQSDATNLVSADTNAKTDVFIRDTVGMTTTRVSVASNGTQGDGNSYGPAPPEHLVSSDGRYVVFQSSATNLVSPDTNSADDVFIRDLTAATTVKADQTPLPGACGEISATNPSISADGRYVTFEAVNGACGNFWVYDRQTGDSAPVYSGNGVGADIGSLSDNDRYAMFGSLATDIVPGDTNNCEDIFERDLQTLTTVRVSVDSNGNQVTCTYTRYPVASSDGRYVAFETLGFINVGGSGYQVWMHFSPNPAVPPGQLIGHCSACDARSGQPLNSAGRPVGMRGEPVNLANGSYYESATDATMPDIGIPFAFTRTYNSADTTPSQATPPAGGSPIDQPIPISQGWTSAYNIYLRQSNWLGDLVLHTGDGQQITFVKQADGTYLGGAGVRETLVKNGDQTYTVTRHDLVKYQLDTSGNVTSIKDRNNQGLTFTYTSGHITSISGNGAWSVTLGYTSGRLTSLSLPLSRSVGYHYNASNLLDKVTDIRGNFINYTYTTAADAPQPPNLVKTAQDQRGNVVAQNTYDATGRVASQIDARNHPLSYGWNPQTQVATFTDARGKTWTYTYSNGALVQVADPLGDTTKYGYDPDLNGTTITDGRNNTITYVYDTAGNLTQESDPAPLSYQENWTYDSNNNLLSFQDGRSPRRTTLYGYDAGGNLTCMTLPLQSPPATCSAAGSSSKWTYARDPSGNGLLSSVTDPNINTTAFTYNNMGEPLTVVTQLGFVTKLCYDAGGRMTKRIDPRATANEDCTHPGSFTWTYGYNNANQMNSAQDPLTHLSQWGYDPDGFVATRTDANNHVIRYEYDAASNLTCVIGPDTAATTCAAAPQTSKTTYGYDNNDNLTSRTDANSHIWTYTPDDANRLQSVTSPAGAAWGFSYWPNGLVHVKTLPSGSITYDYDALNRLSGLTYSNAPTTPNVTFSFDANGNRTQMTDGSGTVNYVYGDENRLSTATRGSDVFSYTYYAGGQLKQVTYPDNASVGYQYDGDERLCSVTIGAITTSCTTALTNTTKYAYDKANDLITKTFPAANGYVATMTYDNADRMTKVVNKKGNTTLSSFNLGTLDGVGNPPSLTKILGGTTTTTYYTYDPYDRLTGACNKLNCTGSGLTGLGYTYDPVGNRLTQVAYGAPNVTTTYKYSVDDKLCWAYVGTSSNACSSPPGGSTIYAFETNGNETGAGSTTYAYDLENRMVSATVAGTTTAYTNDGDGNRLSATTSGSTTGYLWDVNEPLAQLALERSGGSTLMDYSYGSGVNSMSTGSSNYFYLLDAYSGVANLTSSTGATEWTYATDPFGTGTATKNDPSAPANMMRFDGQFLDPTTGLFNLRARTYDPTLARFLEIDPVPLSTRQPYTASYVYVGDRPTLLSDPSGMDSSIWHKVTYPFVEFGKDWWAGRQELWEDWQAGPTLPKVVGGALVVVAVVCLAAPEVCVSAGVRIAAAAGSLAAAANQCAQPAVSTLEDGPSDSMIAAFEQQLAEHGPESLEDSLESIQQNLSEHLAKLASGGYTSSIEREIRTFTRQIEAIKIVLGRS
jgi:RHS repeat-associated protein